MWRYIARRILISIPILIGLTIITFVLVELMPGDFVDALVPPESLALYTPEQLAKLRTQYGLDKPAYVRYLLWLRELGQGNLGYSLASGEPVLTEIMQRLPATLQLTGTALLFGVVVGTILGIISAVKQYSWLDQLLTVLGFVWISTPSFVFGLIALYIFSLKLDLFPTGGAGPVGEPAGFFSRSYYLVLPTAVLGLEHVAGYMRYARSSLLDVIRQDYMVVARAKGLADRLILLRHGLRNALLPLITIMSLSLPGLIGGAVIIEAIFTWPGMGTYALNAVHTRDYGIIMGVNFVASSLVLLSNLVADILYAVADPRIRYGEG